MSRDLRDPDVLGRTLLAQALPVRGTYGKGIKLSSIYDEHVSDFAIPNVSGDDSMGKACAAEYREELEVAAAAGDKYAASRLRLLVDCSP